MQHQEEVRGCLDQQPVPGNAKRVKNATDQSVAFGSLQCKYKTYTAQSLQMVSIINLVLFDVLPLLFCVVTITWYTHHL